MPVSYAAIIRQMKKELESLDESTPQHLVVSKMHVIQSLANVVINAYDGEPISRAESEGGKLMDVDHSKPEISASEAKVMGIHKSKSEVDAAETKFTGVRKTKPEISEEEAKMMGINKTKPSHQTRLDEDDANGDSIFDF